MHTSGSRTQALVATLLLVPGLLAAGCADNGQEPTPADASAPASAPPVLDEALTAELQSATDDVVAELGAPGAVVLVTTPDDRWETAVGDKDLDTGEPMETGLRWPLRSITKSFTVTAVLQLVDEGRIALDDTVDTWIEGVPNGDRVTVRQLADMSSGLADYTTDAFIDDFVADPARELTVDELIAYATAEPARAEPGDDRVYTNLNTILLGRIVEEATGIPFDEVLAGVSWLVRGGLVLWLVRGGFCGAPVG